MKLSISWKICLIGLGIVGVMTAFILVYILPSMQKSTLQTQIKQEVQIAFSILDSNYQKEKSGVLSHEDAQKQAIEEVRNLRFGPQNSDYFWINDFRPVMIMHPYKPQLEGQDLSNNKDPNGKTIFVDFANICKQQGEGYSTYQWQYNSDANRIESKTSFVKAFQPWGWIIGTGLYSVDVNQSLNVQRNQLLVIFCIISVICLAILFLVTRVISSGINQISKALKKIAVGDLTYNVNIKSSDEVGAMSQSYNEMQKSVSGLILQLKENAQQLALASDQLSQAAKQTGMATQQVATSSQQMAKGAQEQSSSAQDTAKSIEELSSAINQLAVSSREQSGGVQKAVSSISSVSQTVSQVSVTAQQAAELARKANASATSGAEKTRQTLAGMDKIKQATTESARKIEELGVRSAEIGKIVAVIDDIASQTNLLALNAAIEAARAGDQGRGFAVVSDEVRKLAERTASATKEIADLISGVQKGVNEATTVMTGGSAAVTEGYQLATQAQQTLEEIMQSASNVNTQIEEISAKTPQVNTATEDLVKVIDSVGGITEQNTAASEQMTASATQVSKVVETVAGIAEENSAATEEVSASAEEMSAQVEEIVASSQTLKEMADNLKNSAAAFKVKGGEAPI
jgi:methyl-accepting chemotaxis protein